MAVIKFKSRLRTIAHEGDKICLSDGLDIALDDKAILLCDEAVWLSDLVLDNTNVVMVEPFTPLGIEQ